MGLLNFCLLMTSCMGQQNISETVGLITTNEVVMQCNDTGDCIPRLATGRGTATRVRVNGKYYWLTAGHVCAPFAADPSQAVRSMTVTVLGTTEPVQLGPAVYTATPDLCMFEAERGPARKIGNGKELRSGQDLHIFAFPGGVYAPDLYPKYTGNYMGAVNEFECVSNVPIAPGSSGAGVINWKGEVVGVISAVLTNFNHFSIFVCPGPLKEFVKGATQVHETLDLEAVPDAPEKETEQSQTDTAQ